MGVNDQPGAPIQCVDCGASDEGSVAITVSESRVEVKCRRCGAAEKYGLFKDRSTVITS